jgi:hypothetical protein
MGWTFFWLMVVLKVPIVAAVALVWWAIRAEVPATVPGSEAPSDDEDSGEDDDGGGGVRSAHRTRPRRPRRPRGPHGAPTMPSPPRVRGPVPARARQRTPR